MTDVLGWVPVLVVVVGLLVWYLTFSASRIDRLHHRVEASRAGLDAQLARRAGLALDLAPLVGPPAGPELAAASSQALPVESAAMEDVQNRLTRALHAAFDDTAAVGRLRDAAAVDGQLDQLAAACGRVQMARRFHNDAVAHTQRMRRKRVVRWARLAGRAAMPQMIEIDDRVPAGLSSPAGRVP